MLILVLLLSLLAGHCTVAALRSPEQPWQGRDLFWGALIGLCLTSWLGQALADVGWFSLWLILGALMLYSGLLAWRNHQRLVPYDLRIDWRQAALLAVVLGVGAALYLHPAETPIGGRDDALRLFSGSILAREGGWVRPMPAPPLPRQPGLTTDVKYLGIEFLDAQRQQSVLQFTGVHEVWQAIGYGLSSVDVQAPVSIRSAHPGMLFLNPLLALFALLACYVLGTTLWEPTTAFVGTLLLAINMAQVWYARQTMAEILLQALLLGGTAACIAYLRAPGRVTALAAGLALGVALLTKVDALIALGVLFAVAVVVWPRRARWRGLPWLLAPLVGCLIHYALHSLWYSQTYFRYNLGGFRGDPNLVIATIFAVAVVFGLVALRAHPGLRRWLDRLLTTSLPQAWRVALLIGLLLLLGYGYFVRPTVLAQEGYTHPLWGTPILSYRGLTVVLLVEYLTPLGASLALAGLAYFLTRTVRWQHLPFVAILLGYSVIFLYNARISSDQPFWVRRFLPVVIPGALLLAGAALVALFRTGRRKRWLAPVLLLSLLVWSGWRTAPVAAIQSGAGLGAQIAALAANIPPQAVVLYQDWEAAFTIAPPLELLYERESYQLPGRILTGGEEQQWRAQIDAWMRAGRPVVYVATDGRLTLPEDGIAMQFLSDQTLRFRTIETTQDQLPARGVEMTQRLALYEIVPAPSLMATCSTTVEIGGDDYGAIGAGFYASEQLGAQDVRWSKGAASLLVPPLTGTSDVVITLTLNDARPVEAGPATLQVSSGGQTLATQPLQAGWRDYQLRIPATLASQATTTLDLNVAAWSPQAFGQADARELGVLVDKFSARRATCATP